MKTINMGIRGLERIIKHTEANNKSNKSINKTMLSAFSGKFVCIDTSEFIVRSLIKSKNYHVSGILNLLEKCLKNDIFPYFVFDGKPPEEKSSTIKERNKRKQQAHNKIKNLNEQSNEMLEINELITKLNTINENETMIPNDGKISPESDKTQIKKEILSRISSTSSLVELMTETPTSCSDDEEDVFLNGSFKQTIEDKLITISEEKKKLKKKCYSYNASHINDIQQLLDMIKIPYINCNCESDIICAALCKLGIVDAVISNDMDFVILGTPKVIRGLNFRDDNIDVYIYENIKNNLGFSNEKIVELSLLLGCDYCQRVVNLKNKYVYRIFKYFVNLDELIDNLDNIKNIEFTEEDKADVDFMEYIETEEFNLDETIDIYKLKNMFLLDIDIKTMNKMISNNTFIDMNINYQVFKNYISDIDTSSKEYGDIVKYCEDKCIQLNKVLITKKCSIILGIHTNNDNNNDYLNNNFYKQNNHYFNDSNMKREIYRDVRSKSSRTYKSKPFTYVNNNTAMYIN